MEQPRWLNNPRYQKAILKMSRMDPTRQAIVDTVIADETFADQEMRNRLAMMRLAAQKTANERSLSLGEGRLALGEKRLAFDKQRADARYDLAGEKFDIGKDDSATAQNIGWVNLGVSGLQGYNELKEKKRKAKRDEDLASIFRKNTGN